MRPLILTRWRRRLRDNVRQATCATLYPPLLLGMEEREAVEEGMFVHWKLLGRQD